MNSRRRVPGAVGQPPFHLADPRANLGWPQSLRQLGESHAWRTERREPGRKRLGTCSAQLSFQLLHAWTIARRHRPRTGGLPEGGLSNLNAP